jgi:hypothetical protein
MNEFYYFWDLIADIDLIAFTCRLAFAVEVLIWIAVSTGVIQ